MTHIVPERVVGVPAQPVAVASVSSIKFEIRDLNVIFYETPEAPNNIDVFQTFDLARSAAIQAFAKHKASVLATLTQTEKELRTAQGPSQVVGSSVTASVASNGAVPTAVVPKAPVVSTTPIA